MAEYDLFEITGLSFDPPEKAAKKIKSAIEKAERSLGGMLGSVSQQAQRDEINEKLSLLSRLKGEVLSGDGKVLPRFSELAQERREAAKKRLEAAVRLEKLSKKELVITSGKVKSQKKITRLSKESIEEVYKSHGFAVVDIDPLAAMPKFPTNAEKIHNELEILRKSRDPNPKGADPTGIRDLYGFAAYLKGEPENAPEYGDMSTKELSALFDEYAKQNAMRNDPLGKLCVSIATAGKMNVFNTEANRKAYEQFLLFKSPELTELFSIMKDSVPSDLRDSGFAEICIRKITEVFGDSDAALAIYNNEAGLRDDPYIPEKASFSVKCACCQNVSEYVSFEEAKRINRCRHCGKEVYKKCARCGKMMLSGANRCPECGFVSANAGMYAKYFALAESALRQGRLEEARRQLIRAKTADPDEHHRTAALEKLIDAEEAKIAEPLKKLRSLMTCRQYKAAEDFMREMAKENPRIDLTDQRKEIDEVLSRCRSRYAACKAMSVSEKIKACLEILDLCEDFPQANEELNGHPPTALSEITAGYDDEKKAVILSWPKSGEYGVSYVLIRKNGPEPSEGIHDGTVIFRGPCETSFMDSEALSGRQYTYSVFVKRGGCCSAPASAPVRTLAGVAEIHYWQKAGALVFSWELPENSQGAVVTYSVGGKENLLAENARESVELKNIQYGSPYVISVAANYGKLGKSAVRQLSVTPTPIVESFRITAGAVKDGACSIGWSIAERGVDIQILAEGTVVRTARSEMRSCTLQFALNRHYKVQVKALSGGQWISSENVLIINTYEPALIDSAASVITEKAVSSLDGMKNQVEIKIKIEENIPGETVAFYCIVKTKASGESGAPWAAEEDAKGIEDRIDYETYMQWREITKRITAGEEDAYYVTLFSVYRVGGEEVLSAPCRKKFNRPLNANVFWKVTKPVIGNAKLSIEIEANRPMVKRPGMVLCASPQGKQLLSPEDASAVELLRLPEVCYDEPRDIVEESCPIAAAVRRREKVYLFITDKANNEQYAVRWAMGFSGKI